MDNDRWVQDYHGLSHGHGQAGTFAQSNQLAQVGQVYTGAQPMSIPVLPQVDPLPLSASSFDAVSDAASVYFTTSSPVSYLHLPSGPSEHHARSAPATLHMPQPVQQVDHQISQLVSSPLEMGQVHPSPFFLAHSVPTSVGVAASTQSGYSHLQPVPISSQAQSVPQQSTPQLHLQPQVHLQADLGLGQPPAYDPSASMVVGDTYHYEQTAPTRLDINPMALFGVGIPLPISTTAPIAATSSPYATTAIRSDTWPQDLTTAWPIAGTSRSPSMRAASSAAFVTRSEPVEVRAAPYAIPRDRVPRIPRAQASPADRRFIAWTWPTSNGIAPAPQRSVSTRETPSPPTVSSDGSAGGTSSVRKRIRAVPVRATPAQRRVLDLEFATNQYPTEEVLRRLEREFAPDGNGATVSTLKAWFTDRRSKTNRALRRTNSRSGWSEGLAGVVRARLEHLSKPRGDTATMDLFPVSSFSIGSWGVVAGAGGELCVALRPAAFEAFVIWEREGVIYRLALRVDEIRVTRIARNEKNEPPHCRVHVMRNALELHCRSAHGGDGWVPARDVSGGAIGNGGRIKICGAEEIVMEIGRRLSTMLRSAPRVVDPAQAIKELWAAPSRVLSTLPAEIGVDSMASPHIDGNEGHDVYGAHSYDAVLSSNAVAVAPSQATMSQGVVSATPISAVSHSMLAPGLRLSAIDNSVGVAAADVTGAGDQYDKVVDCNGDQQLHNSKESSNASDGQYRLSRFEEWFADSVQDAVLRVSG